MIFCKHFYTMEKQNPTYYVLYRKINLPYSMSIFGRNYYKMYAFRYLASIYFDNRGVL